jgi:ribosomal protein S18 acetylase RimI-like enzyme
MAAEDEFAIRRVTSAEVALLAELASTTFVETFGHLYPRVDLEDFLATAMAPKAYASLIRDPGAATWFAVAADGYPVGFAVAGDCKLPVPGLEPGAGEIRNLYVRGTHQKHRLGTRLLETALEWLEARGPAPLYVGVWSENHGAQRLYGRYGFAKIGEYEFPVGRQRDREFILKRPITSI